METAEPAEGDYPRTPLEAFVPHDEVVLVMLTDSDERKFAVWVNRSDQNRLTELDEYAWRYRDLCS